MKPTRGAKCLFSDLNRDVLKNVQSSHKWWSTLKSAVFSTSLSLPPFVSGDIGLACQSVGNADMSRIILTAITPGNLLIYCSLAIHLLVVPPLPSDRVRSDVSC